MVQRGEGVEWPPLLTRPFVGRSMSLGRLDRALDEALTGRPRAVFVEGPAGIGKSRLVGELLAKARRRGAIVLVGRCSEDLAVPYLPLAHALEPLGEDLGVARQLLDPASATPDDPLAALDERTAPSLVALCRAAVLAARRRPVVLLLEDLHWADRHTAELFEQLVTTAIHSGTTSSTAILLIATLRPSEGHVTRITERLGRESAVRSIPLSGMSEFELNDLLTSIAPARPSRALLSMMMEATDGNPLLASTVLARLVVSGNVEVRRGELVANTTDVLTGEGGLDDELRRRLARVGRPCRELLTRLAFLGDGGLLDDVEAVSSPEMEQLLDEAESAGLLRDDGHRYYFDHPQLRQLLYHEPGGRHRQRLHLALADHLEHLHRDDPRRAIEIASHLRRSGSRAEPERLARFCIVAGDQAFALAAWGTAARFLDVALVANAPADVETRARLELQAGIGHFRDHDLGPAEERLLEAVSDARAAGDIDIWAAAAMVLTRARMTIGTASLGVGVELGELEELLATGDLPARLQAQITGLMAEVHFHAFDVNRGLALADEARRLVGGNDDAVLTHVELAAGLQHLGRLELDAAVESFDACATHALALPDPWQRVWGLGRLPLAEVMNGDLERAADHAAEAAGIASANHDWAEHALASACLMQVMTCRGEFTDSETAGALASQMYHRSDYAFVPPLIYPAMAAVRALRGDVDGAYEALGEWTSSGARGLAPYRLLIIAATQDRDRLASVAPFRPVGAGSIDLFSMPILCAQAEVATVLGDVALLQDALDPLRTQHQAGVRWCLGWPLLVARLIAAAQRVLGRVDEAEQWCDIAATEAARNGASAEAARISLERARLADASGDRETACAMALEAARTFDGLGMLPLHQEALRIIGDRAVHERVVRTVLFTDLVDSTATNVRRGDDAYVELLDLHNAILRRRIRQFDGVEIKHTGDGLSSWFTSATAACECALATRDDLAEHNDAHPDGQLHVRFGLASGAPISREGDLFGVSVTLAARLCDQASPGQILVSEDVAAATEGTRLSFRALPPVHLKGFPEAVALFAVGVHGG